MRWPIFMFSLIFIAPPACDADGGDGGLRSGTITLAAEQGADFHTGRVQEPGHFANSDLYASRNGTALKLATGGPNPITNHPVNWFLGQNGLHLTFAALADVPAEPPTDAMTESLVRARPGNGFVLRSHKGAWVRGWLVEATASHVTIVYAPLDPSE